MISINKVLVQGRISSKAEIKSKDGDRMLVTFSVATNKRYKDRDGEWQTEKQFHKIAMFNSIAKNNIDKIKIGLWACIEGRLTTKSYTTNNGDKAKFTQIVASKVKVERPKENKIA